jgi:hypothetical protein
MNGFNEMNYHQIKSRENFLFMFSALAASAESFSGVKMRENREKVYIRERKSGGDERELRKKLRRTLEENSLSLSPHLR